MRWCGVWCLQITQLYGHVAEAGLRGHGTVSGTILQAPLTVYDDPVSLTGGQMISQGFMIHSTPWFPGVNRPQVDPPFHALSCGSSGKGVPLLSLGPQRCRWAVKGAAIVYSRFYCTVGVPPGADQVGSIDDAFLVCVSAVTLVVGFSLLWRTLAFQGM